jgi:hypothetical protein
VVLRQGQISKSCGPFLQGHQMTYPTKPDVERLLLTLLRGTGVLPQILNEVVKKIVDQETIKQFLDQEDGTVEKAIGLAFQAYQNLPKKTSNVLGGVVSGVLLAAEYGLFLCIWNYFETVVSQRCWAKAT